MYFKKWQLTPELRKKYSLSRPTVKKLISIFMIEGNYLGLSEEVLLFSVTVNLITDSVNSLACGY